MSSQHNSLVFLATTLLVTLTSQSSFAFSITPDQPGDSDGTYKYSDRYELRQGITKLDAWSFPDPRRLLPGQVPEIKPGGTDTLLDQLNSQFGRQWEFIPKGDLEGSFNIENYFACGSDFPCSHNGISRSDSVGAFFRLNYIPEGNDPTGNTVHWIQRVISNFDIGYDNNGKPIVIDDQVPKDRLDIRLGAGSPYYDESYPDSGSNPTLFFDLPNVQAPFTRTNHYFYAETYLVNEVPGGTTDPDTGIVKNRVEIYSGVRWGWENTFTPSLSCPSSRVDATVTPVGDKFLYEFEVFNTSPVLSGSGYGGDTCDEIVDWELPLFDVEDLDVTSITSPSSWNFEILPPDGTSDYYNNPDSPYNPTGWNYTAADDPLLIADADLYGSNPQVFENPPLILHWYNPADSSSNLPTNSIFPGGSLGEFSFLSDFAPKNAPYLSSWFNRPPRRGDPPIPFGLTFATPNSSSRQQAQDIGNPISVPEPGSLLGLLGIGVLGVLAQVKNQKS